MAAKLQHMRRRLALIQEWSSWFHAQTESWKVPLGTQLAYLFAAMANDHYVELSRSSALVRLLRRENIPSSNRIWQFIRLTN